MSVVCWNDDALSRHMTTSRHAAYRSNPHAAQICPAVKVLTYLNFALNQG